MKNIVKVEITDVNREKVEFAKSIDFEPLWKAIREKVGQDIVFETPEICGRHNADIVTIEWQSANLKDEAGIMRIAYKDLRICNFGGTIEKDKKTGEWFYWCSVHWGFEYADGGSNGSAIMRVRFTKTSGWEC